MFKKYTLKWASNGEKKTNVASKLSATWKRKNSSWAVICSFILWRHLEIPFLPATLFRLATRCQAFIADLNSFALQLMQASFLSVNVRYSKMISPSQFQPTTWELDFEYENKVIRLSRFIRACAASGGSIPISVYSWLSFIFKISLHLWYTPATISFHKTDMHLFPKIWLHFK